MILVDTSIWIDHFNVVNDILELLLHQEKVLSHAFVIGELAMGNVQPRGNIFKLMRKLSAARIADNNDVLEFVGRHKLFGSGIGYIDAHLLASAQLTPETKLWTRDKRMLAAADRLGLAWEGPLLN